MGDVDAATLVVVESLVKYHSDCSGYLTVDRDPVQGQCLMGSLTGVVASKSVTEASKGTLRPIGNRSKSVMA